MEQFLGDYRILRKIGEEALGHVLLAEHRFLKKQFALKVLPKEFSLDQKFIDHFEKKISQLALLDHPNIVKIHNISFAEDHYFLIADPVLNPQGEPSNMALFMSARKERLNEEEILSILRQVAAALDHIHVRGMAHGALKLTNFLIGAQTPGVHLLISDFGLATIIPPSHTVAYALRAIAEALESLTSDKKGERDGQFSGSFLEHFSFLAPEQKRLHSVTAAADVFAFGVFTYYLLSGHFPEGVFPMPSKTTPEYLIDWDYILCHCLNPNPNERPTTLLPLLEREKEKREPFIAHKQEQVGLEELHKEASETVNASFLRAPLSHGEREEPHLSPFVQKNLDHLLEVAIQPMVMATTATNGKEVLLNENNEETYAQQLSAMLNRDPIITQYPPSCRNFPFSFTRETLP